MTGKVKEQWGKLTDDDMTAIEGKRDQLVGRVQERYGIAKDKAEKQVSSWERQAVVCDVTSQTRFKAPPGRPGGVFAIAPCSFRVSARHCRELSDK